MAECIHILLLALHRTSHPESSPFWTLPRYGRHGTGISIKLTHSDRPSTTSSATIIKGDSKGITELGQSQYCKYPKAGAHVYATVLIFCRNPEYTKRGIHEERQAIHDKQRQCHG